MEIIEKTLKEIKELSRNILIEDSYKRSNIRVGRATGNTTRTVNTIIEDLWQHSAVRCVDCFENGTHKFANEDLFTKVLDRISREDGLLKIIVDYKTFTIFIPNQL